MTTPPPVPAPDRHPRAVRRWRLADWPLATKLGIGFGLIMLLLTINALTFFAIQERQESEREWTEHTYQVIEALQQLENGTVNMQNGLRGYQLTRDAEYLVPYHAGADAARRAIATVRGLVVDNMAQTQRIDDIERRIKAWQLEIAEPTRTLIESGSGTAESVEYTVRGKSYREALRALLTEATETERRLLAQRRAQLTGTADLTRQLTLLLLLLAMLLTIYAIRRTRTRIAEPIAALTTLMSRLANHDDDIDVPHQSRGDEIGNIARALEVFKAMAVEIRTQNWVKTEVGDIASDLQEVRSAAEFARVLSAALAPKLGCGFVALYGYEGERQTLELLGGFALSGDMPRRIAVEAGGGLLGECARSHRTLVVDKLPPDYVRIGSGAGSAVPTSVLLQPLLVQNQLHGVLELASFDPFTVREQQLLDELMPIVALSFDNLRRALRTQDLLVETQTQSEELQASEESLRVQQEELRAINDSLESKTRMLEEQSARLRVSEEELKLQAEELRVTNESLTNHSATLREQKLILEELQRETQEKADALARASQYKSEFLANMSHELRTPLNSLLILSRSLSDNEEGHLAPDEVESAKVIHESGSKLLQLINDILDLSKVEAGKLEVMVDELQVTAFSQSLSRNFRHVARERELSFEITVADDAPAVIRTDAARLEQIANNLLGNAFKFTKQGGVTVTIGRPALGQRLPPGLGREQALSIAVSDTGIGIPADKFHKMFQTFQQVDAGTSRQFGGTGLGLSIARGMARRLGGDIQMQSTFGEGSTFTIVLPVEAPTELRSPLDDFRRPSPSAMDRSTATDDSETPAAQTVTVSPSIGLMPTPTITDDRELITEGDTVILIVEDDPAFARILAELIRRRGYRVLAAGDGESGLKLAKEFRPAGVLLDVMLPGMDGWAVLDRLKADDTLKELPVHFISANDEAARGLEAGAIGFLTKPVSKAALLQAFDRLLHPGQEQVRRVLLIDDDAASRHAMRSLLNEAGVELVDAGSGEEGLEQLGKSRFDCIVLDLGLPGMSGNEFLEVASRSGPLPPVVIHSGRELSREESLALRQYTDSIVIKGARSPERLLDEVSLFLHSLKPAAPLPVREIDARLNGRTVLIVDDDMRNIFALSKMLRARGLKVLMAQDGRKALKQLEDNDDVNLMLMDIMMPGMDGYDTMRAIRAQPKHRKLPMIALTAKAMRGDREKCLEAGASDYLSKPIDIDKLLSMMRVWMSHHA